MSTDTTSVRAKARAAQFEEFADHADIPQIVKDQAEKVYSGIDALDIEGRSLLIEETLTRVNTLVMQAGMSGQMDVSMSEIVAGMIGVAGYANAASREDSGYTSTGDTRITEILDAFKAMVKEAAYDRVDLTEEERVQAQALSERCVKIAEETGEPVLAVIERESNAFLAKVAERKGEKVAPAAASTTKVEETPNRYSDDGLYL